tara:strand:+ start:99 stop:317 length:219 start_codon:yes stop_codon:yes gene_type:complete
MCPNLARKGVLAPFWRLLAVSISKENKNDFRPFWPNFGLFAYSGPGLDLRGRGRGWISGAGAGAGKSFFTFL